MGHYLPIFFLPIEKSNVPPNLKSWSDATEILGERGNPGTEFGTRISYSRNWWHQKALDEICDGLGIQGLKFVREEIVCLNTEELELAANALDQLMGQISNGIPNLEEPGIESADIWELRQPRCEGAFALAQPTYEIDVVGDAGFRAAVGFYSFIKSLHQTVNEAIGQEKYLLYVQPQP